MDLSCDMRDPSSDMQIQDIGDLFQGLRRLGGQTGEGREPPRPWPPHSAHDIIWSLGEDQRDPRVLLALYRT